MGLKIFVTRHGQDEDNESDILNGHRDMPLTHLGRDQAEDLGKKINKLDLKFDVVYSSPLRRAHETAEIIAKVANLPQPKTLAGLIERDFGELTGKTRTEAGAMRLPGVITTKHDTFFTVSDRSESFPSLIKRAERVLKSVRAEQREGNVLLVCHRDIALMLCAVAKKIDWQDALTNVEFGNCNLFEISKSGIFKVV